ncbi:hypothetical protein NBRC116587_37870 [Pseudoteredinibacter isoporae]
MSYFDSREVKDCRSGAQGSLLNKAGLDGCRAAAQLKGIRFVRVAKRGGSEGRVVRVLAC